MEQPFLPHPQAICGVEAPPGEIDLLLVQLLPCTRPAFEPPSTLATRALELQPRKAHVRVAVSVLRRSDRLRALLPAAETNKTPLVIEICDEALTVDAIAGALAWMALPPAEQRGAIDRSTWRPACALLHAAAWIGCRTLVRHCELVLRDHLIIENAVPLARAAERCAALHLLGAAFFLLKAYFCVDSDDNRPLLSAPSRVPPPRLTAQGVRHGKQFMPHAGWRAVLRAFDCRAAVLRAAQPCYTLCTLTRERREGRPSLFRLVSEHDGRLLLVARQMWAGEGDYYLFAPPDDDDLAWWTAAAGASGGGPVGSRCGPRAAAAAAVEFATSTAAFAAGGSGAPAPAATAEAATTAPSATDASGEAADSAGGAAADSAAAPAAATAARRDGASALRAKRLEAFVESIWGAGPDALPEHSPAFRGCLSARWLGTQFSVYDAGLRPAHIAKGFPFAPREELAAVSYATNILKNAPHSLHVVLRDCNQPADGGGGGVVVGESASQADDAACEVAEAADALASGDAPGAVGDGCGTSGAGGVGRAGGAAGAGGVSGSSSSSSSSGALALATAAAAATGSRALGAALGGTGSLTERSRSGHTEGLHTLRNTKPEWDEKVEAYTLPFYQVSWPWPMAPNELHISPT